MNRLALPILIVLSIAAAVWTGRIAIPGALYGWDAYPLIAAARFESIGAFFGTFTEELMDGRYPQGSFYRPVLHLMLGFEHSVGGLNPAVYGAVGAAVAALAGVAVALAARRLGAHAVAAGIACAFFVLNPAADHVTWFMPRRPESLVVLFTAATLAAQAKPGLDGRSRAVWSFALALLASGSKESGVLVLPLVYILHASERGVGGALRPTAPVAAAVALFVAVRTWVLGGLGGHPESSLANVAAAHTFAEEQLGLVLGSPSGLALAAQLVPLGVIAALAAARKDSRPAALVPLAWLAGNVVLSAVSGVQRPWYAYQLLGPLALLAAACADRTGLRLAVGAAAAVALAYPIATGGTAADRAELDRSANAFLEGFAEIVGPAREGTIVRVPGFRAAVKGPTGTVFLHKDYGLDAYAELIGVPNARCVSPRERPAAAPGVVTVALERAAR